MSGSGFTQFIPLILIFVIFYFFLIRPQQKRAKDHKAMVAALKRGDEVITAGGICATVERVLEGDKVEVFVVRWDYYLFLIINMIHPVNLIQD